jgi:hypothetical protein
VSRGWWELGTPPGCSTGRQTCRKKQKLAGVKGIQLVHNEACHVLSGHEVLA